MIGDLPASLPAADRAAVGVAADLKRASGKQAVFPDHLSQQTREECRHDQRRRISDHDAQIYDVRRSPSDLERLHHAW